MNRRLLSLALIVLVPVIVLAILAGRGIQAQRRAAWGDKRAEAERIMGGLASEMSGRLQHGAIPLSTYPDPPLPVPPTEENGQLDGAGTADALRAIRDNPRAGFSKTGLPARLLAAARLLEMENTPANADALLSLAMESEPSVLTSVVLEAAEKKGIRFSSPWRERWTRQQRTRTVVAHHPQVDRSWIKEGEDIWWIDRGASIAIGPEALGNVLSGKSELLPSWAKLRFRVMGLKEYADAPLAQSAIKDYPGLSLQIVAPDHSLVEASVRDQERLAFLMVGGALLTAILGLVLIHRTLARERRLNELKSHFVASVSHELRAPVGSIRLMADALDAGKVSSETAADFHRLISREGKRLTHLIENVLDFARIEQGSKRWHVEEADLPTLVSDTVKVMAPLAAEKRISLTFEENAFHADPLLDPDAIQQALINLLDNAIKFSPENSDIEISLSSDDCHWQLAVRDHGPGIPPAEQTKIFERFYRPGDELRRETQGTGIGLSLVKAIAEAHGGRIDLTSRPGHGSTFTLSIPIDATAGH